MSANEQGRAATVALIIEAALQERLDAACPDFWPDLGSWAEDAVAALYAAGYVIEQRAASDLIQSGPDVSRLRATVATDEQGEPGG
jgi:hypothetical protein